MAQRQGRRSLGLAPLPGLGDELTEAQRFEDFRRRHSKQNKEIIVDNVTRKNMVKSLQDDIHKLNIELLNVRQANLKLQAKLNKIQNDKNNLNNNNQIYENLNQLIKIFPALKNLRDSLSPSSTSINSKQTQEFYENGLINGISLVENNYATRPAEMARQNHGLWSLVEVCGNEGEKQRDDVRKVKRIGRGRHTGIGSIANSRSPRRSTQSPKISYVEITSPSPSRIKPTSPSPKKAASSSSSVSVAGKKQRKRRESGLITIPPRSPSPKPIPESVEMDYGETSEWEEGKAVELSPSDTQLNKEDIHIPSDAPIPLSSSIGPGSREVELLDTIREVSTTESGTSGSSSSRQYSAEEHTNLDEEGIGRARRARSRLSVNYKEPSLSKKMRKPDGIPTEEILISTKPISSRSLASTSSSSVPSSHTNTPPKFTIPLDDSPLSPLPDEFEQNQHKLNTKSRLVGTNSSNTLIKQNGMRRKSTLPKIGLSKKVIEKEDEDDVDDLINIEIESKWEDDLKDVKNKTKNLLLNNNSPLKSKQIKKVNPIIKSYSTSINKSSFTPINSNNKISSLSSSKSSKSTIITDNLVIGKSNLSSSSSIKQSNSIIPKEIEKISSNKKIDDILIEGDNSNLPKNVINNSTDKKKVLNPTITTTTTTTSTSTTNNSNSNRKIQNTNIISTRRRMSSAI
ncbi:uncharacterized protein I206_102894 [Kwoniella pini CBS 10737]|uniref:Shugoshin C-terminal domain-containing protein n=1 Tax=Kwoniella pini CBS 10737 TaxID=1296096 RepID=A0A1B9I6N4_9TREE|nr:uncharacterized protein I206_03244 [Kwoniella pini CBS 10737]OCF51178.1 hypothetical protein I206_03244 [Kwoniella pini CBS 10737]